MKLQLINELIDLRWLFEVALLIESPTRLKGRGDQLAGLTADAIDRCARRGALIWSRAAL